MGRLCSFISRDLDANILVFLLEIGEFSSEHRKGGLLSSLPVYFGRKRGVLIEMLSILFLPFLDGAFELVNPSLLFRDGLLEESDELAVAS